MKSDSTKLYVVFCHSVDGRPEVYWRIESPAVPRPGDVVPDPNRNGKAYVVTKVEWLRKGSDEESPVDQVLVHVGPA